MVTRHRPVRNCERPTEPETVSHQLQYLTAELGILNIGKLQDHRSQRRLGDRGLRGSDCTVVGRI